MRSVLETTWKAYDTTFRQRIVLAAGSAGDRVDFEFDIDWRTSGKLLKMRFPLTARAATARYGLACGTIDRGTNTPASYEVPGESWASQSDERGTTAVLTDGSYGWDKPDEATLRLSLLRSPRVTRKFRHQGDQDHGEHQLRFALFAAADWDATASVEEAARRFSNPPRAFPTGAHDGEFGRARSFLDVGRGAVVRALKKAEDRDEIVLRLQESGGKARSVVNFSFSNPVAAARRLDGCERPQDELGSGGRVDLSLGGFELATLGLEIEPPPRPLIRERTVSVTLPYDEQATSSQGEPVGFGSSGESFPAELWPRQVRCGAIPFEFGPAAGDNVVSCDGQTLSWDEPADAIYLAAAVCGERRTAAFSIRDRTFRMEIDAWDGWIGRFRGWRRGLRGLRWARPGTGYLRRDRVAWWSTHRHDRNGDDLVYDYGYIFRYRLDLETADRTLTLPESPSVKVFAATLLTWD